MSEQTRDALSDAIAAHVADETGDMVGAWVVLAETPSIVLQRDPCRPVSVHDDRSAVSGFGCVPFQQRSRR
jgi:hypothetical protein